MLEEPNRLCLAGISTSDRLIKFFLFHQIHPDRIPDLDQEDILTLEDILKDDNDDNFSNPLDNFANF